MSIMIPATMVIIPAISPPIGNKVSIMPALLPCFDVHIIQLWTRHAIRKKTAVPYIELLTLQHWMVYALLRKEVTMQAYCVKCRAKREMKDARAITMKNGKPATQGVCPACGTKMFRIGKSWGWYSGNPYWKGWVSTFPNNDNMNYNVCIMAI